MTYTASHTDASKTLDEGSTDLTATTVTQTRRTN